MILMIMTKCFDNVSFHMIMLPLSPGQSAGVVKQVRIIMVILIIWKLCFE